MKTALKYLVMAGAGVFILKLFSGKAGASSANQVTPVSKQTIDSLIDSIIKKYNDRKYLTDGYVKYWIDKIIKQESGYKNVIGSDGKSIGIMQVTLPTAQSVLNNKTITKENLLNDIELNITAGIKYFIYQLNRYLGNVSEAVVSYNLGSSPWKNPELFLNPEDAKIKAKNYWNGVSSK